MPRALLTAARITCLENDMTCIVLLIMRKKIAHNLNLFDVREHCHFPNFRSTPGNDATYPFIINCCLGTKRICIFIRLMEHFPSFLSTPGNDDTMQLTLS